MFLTTIDFFAFAFLVTTDQQLGLGVDGDRFPRRWHCSKSKNYAFKRDGKPGDRAGITAAVVHAHKNEDTHAHQTAT